MHCAWISTSRIMPVSGGGFEQAYNVQVKQKISGCFLSWDRAKIFCRIRTEFTSHRMELERNSSKEGTLLTIEVPF
ncbi:MAG: hypothetical protein A2X80_02010 [Geobacteraceae bacterium GWB2_52_12]|nr:MAG: hypothetical protein A2X80_02010 [Geobacteraceae bacterium GWB2_52_12]